MELQTLFKREDTVYPCSHREKCDITILHHPRAMAYPLFLKAKQAKQLAQTHAPVFIHLKGRNDKAEKNHMNIWKLRNFFYRIHFFFQPGRTGRRTPGFSGQFPAQTGWCWGGPRGCAEPEQRLRHSRVLARAEFRHFRYTVRSYFPTF